MTRVSDLQTLGDQVGRPQPKPGARVVDKDAARKEASKREVLFKKAVWARDKGLCRSCGVTVIKTLELTAKRGEVHHKRGRNVTPEDRYNIEAAVLLCYSCHSDPAVIAKFRRASQPIQEAKR